MLTQEELKEFESYKKVLKNGEHEIVCEEDENDLIMGVEQEEDEEESIGSNSLDEDMDELNSINNNIASNKDQENSSVNNKKVQQAQKI